ncbi:MAG: tRNA (adenosine(37)-N6)-dimethylallyltransferase MiaA [Lachnospiraceae bacterium]|nr:tRNA (adenosine(37)-N6)-dimethylallyltransferase MiaA [Lachnospiraceae bacterium]
MKPLIILSGPTAVGKTELSIKLAHEADGEIISADSMQVYRTMDIGTAKIKPSEMDGIPHHLIDIIEPEDEWNVSLFAEYAKKAVNDIYSRGKVPVLVGGTGFYIQALLYDVEFSEEDDNEIRKRLTKESTRLGSHALHERLKEIDPVSAEIIHENNVKRVIRALEFYELHHMPISEHNKTQSERKSPYDFRYFVLSDSRDKIYDRIDRRVDKMLEAGLVDEVKGLMDRGLDLSYVSMQGLGYKEIYKYLTGEYTLDEAVYILKRDTRHFAKRQLTWFRHEKELMMISREDYENDQLILEKMLEESDAILK